MHVKVQQYDGKYIQGMVLHITLLHVLYMGGCYHKNCIQGTYHLHTKRQPTQFIHAFGEAFLPPGHVHTAWPAGPTATL